MQSWSKSSVSCTSCIKDGLNQNGTCIPKPQCNDYSYFKKQTHSCDPCPTNCTTCEFDFIDNTIKCSGCWEGAFFNKTKGSCDPEPGCNLASGYFYNSSDNTCNECKGNCSTCSTDAGNTEVICSTCPTGMDYDVRLKICLPKPTCLDGTYYNITEDRCDNCPTNCHNAQTLSA